MLIRVPDFKLDDTAVRFQMLVGFEITYDLTAMLEKYPGLTREQVARILISGSIERFQQDMLTDVGRQNMRSDEWNLEVPKWLEDDLQAMDVKDAETYADSTS